MLLSGDFIYIKNSDIEMKAMQKYAVHFITDAVRIDF